MASTSEELFGAIDAGEVDRVRSMLAADPALATSRDAEGVSALMRARYRFDRAMIEALQSRVAEMDLLEAAAAGDLDRLSHLLQSDRHAPVDAPSGDGFTALHFAAFFGRAEAARLLVAHGADADTHGTGWMTGTPLHSAVSGRHTDVVGVLLEAGANLTYVSRAAGPRCTRPRTTATSRASGCCSTPAPIRRPRTTRVRACSRWLERAATTRRSRRSRPPGRAEDQWRG